MSAIPAELPPTRDISQLPATPGLPIVGSALKIDQHRVHPQVEAWAKELGSIFRMKLGKRELVVISDHQAIGAVLRDRPDGFRRNPLVGKIGAEMGLQSGIFNAEGDPSSYCRRSGRTSSTTPASPHTRSSGWSCARTA